MILQIRKTMMILAACVVAAGLTGCGGDEEKNSAAPTNKPAANKSAEKSVPLVGLFVFNGGDAYVATVAASIAQALGDNVTLETFDAGNNQNKQLEQLDRILSRDVKCLIVNLVDIQRGAQVLEKANRKGVPAVLFNREPDTQVYKTYANLCFVGTNAADAGKMQGDILKKLWTEHPEYDRNRDGKWTFLMLQGPQDNPEALARTEFSIKQALDSGVPLQQFSENLLCHWDRELARAAVAEQLEIHQGVPSFELIIANNDMMALGAIAALQETGYNAEGGDAEKFVPVIGVDAVPAGVEAIDRGIMSATVKQDAAAMGEAVAKIALNEIAGKAFLDGLPYAFDSDEIRAVRIPYAVYNGK